MLQYPPLRKTETCRKWQQRMKDRGWDIAVDGWYGPASKTVCRRFQAEKGLSVDGIVGPNTWRATWESPVT
ncbi:peptidoglycan-binding protein [Actinomadura sp. KC216]|nr:peptidoglycan-binding protein [Actinomadura sp. KC216]